MLCLEKITKNHYFYLIYKLNKKVENRRYIILYITI